MRVASMRVASNERFFMQFVRESMRVASMRGFFMQFVRECMRVASNERFLHAIEYVNESVTDGLINEPQFINTKCQRCSN